MKNLITILASLISVLGIACLATADSGPMAPECSWPYPDQDSPTCKAIDVSFELINSSEFTDKFYILENSSGIFGENYSIHNNGPIGVAYKSTDTYLAIDKNYFDTQGGINGVFESKTISNNEFEETIMSIKNNDEFLKHAVGVIILKTDSFKDYLSYQSGEDFKKSTTDFFRFSNDYYPYSKETLLSPVKEKIMVYEPLGFISDGGQTKLLVYKEKEITTLDNGSKSEKTFKIAEIDGLSKIAPWEEVVKEQVQPENRTELSLWQKFLNFIKRIFGAK